MRIRSYDALDFQLAWKRTLFWAQGGSIDVPDRLPFEVIDRLYRSAGPPFPVREHHLAPVSLVTGSKKSGTSRPFARLSPTDLTLYQALLDRLAPDIERALPPRDVVFAYRQTTGQEADAFAGTPGRAAYESKTQEILGDFLFRVGYAITADIAGFYLHVDIDELEKQLLSVSADVSAVRDVADLLRAWQALGIRGLPQGVRPSSPLGNIYLRPLDQLLRDEGVRFVRWMDDFIVAANGFHEARRVQDRVERLLYDYGLTLAADKTRILRWETAIRESEDARTRLARIKEARRQAAEDWIAEAMTWTDYPPDESELPDPAEIEEDAVIEQYDELLRQLDADEPAKNLGSMAVAIFRDLQAVRRPHAIDQIPRLLMRAPDITGYALRYLVAVSRDQVDEAAKVYAELLSAKRFMRDFEKLDLCASILHLPVRSATRLSTPLEDWALNDEHPLVRARALLAWGAQSRSNDFDAVDEFWRHATSQWRPYALVAIQSKSEQLRDRRLESWSGEGRFLGRLADAIKNGGIGWRKL